MTDVRIFTLLLIGTIFLQCQVDRLLAQQPPPGRPQGPPRGNVAPSANDNPRSPDDTAPRNSDPNNLDPNNMNTNNAGSNNGAPGDASSNAAANAPVPGGGAPAPGMYPPPPKRLFFRGNGIGNPGYYMSLWKLIFMLGMFGTWTWSSRWVSDDSRSLKVRSEFWCGNMLLIGALGLVSVVAIRDFRFGFLVLLICYGVPLGCYVYERNMKVPPNARVLTPKHIREFTIRQLARIGIHIGSRATQAAATGPDIVFIGRSTATDDGHSRSKQVENSKGYLAAKELVYDAILRRCTDIHLEPKEEELSVRLRIDGVMYPTEPFDRVVGDAVINICKVLGAMDITEKRRPQDGSFRAITEGREIDFRVATQGTRQGEKLSLRILDQANSVSNLEQLGLRKQLQENLIEIINNPHGLLLVVGPTGAGKSTTLYAALNTIDAYQKNIITIEDPIEYKMENVTQIEINTKSGQAFGGSLRSVLRQDPDVVMVGEIRDAETAVVACQAANTGHMVFSTLHANDAITALYRLIDLGVEPFMISSSLTAILAQRLARRLCNDCKEAYKPKPEFLKQANLPADKIDVFYRPPTNRESPCPACGGLGYKGRISIVELLNITDPIRDMIRDKASLSTLKAEARKNGMLYMKEEGLRLVVRGVTSIDELLRVVK
ncbi:MAG: GspE/PulE family protein [Planctomycetaceae bacterium]